MSKRCSLCFLFLFFILPIASLSGCGEDKKIPPQPSISTASTDEERKIFFDWVKNHALPRFISLNGRLDNTEIMHLREEFVLKTEYTEKQINLSAISMYIGDYCRKMVKVGDWGSNFSGIIFDVKIPAADGYGNNINASIFTLYWKMSDLYKIGDNRISMMSFLDFSTPLRISRLGKEIIYDYVGDDKSRQRDLRNFLGIISRLPTGDELRAPFDKMTVWYPKSTTKPSADQHSHKIEQVQQPQNLNSPTASYNPPAPPATVYTPQYEEVEVAGIVDHPGSSHGSISNTDGSMGLGFEMVPEIGHRILAMCPIGSRCKVRAKIDTDTLLVQQILSIELLSPPLPPKPREQAKSTKPKQTSTPTSSPVPNQSQPSAKPPYFPFSETALVSYLESVKAIGPLTKVKNTTANPNINPYIAKNSSIFFLVQRDDSGKVTSVAIGAGASNKEEFKTAGSLATLVSGFIREHNGWTIGKDHEETGKIQEFLVTKATKMPKTQESLGTKYFNLEYAWAENNGTPVIVYAFTAK